MHDRPTDKPENTHARFGVHPLKLMSAAQFAALGLETVVFTRRIDGDALSKLVPDARINVEDGPFILVLSADGKPILVTDSEDSLDAWLEDQPVVVARVH
jgi:hypothetical protein